MVKGVSKQAVIVKSRDPALYEQAIFILTKENGAASIESSEEFIKLADSIASEYAFSTSGAKRPKPMLLYALSFAMGLVLAAAAATAIFLLF